MDLPKFHPNERVDLGDVEFLSTGQLGEFQRLFTNLIVGEATKRIIDGFTFTIQSATVMQIALGKAVLAENRNAAVRYGQLVGGGAPLEGVATQNVSFSGLAVATHGIFVRFVYGDSTLGNRAFWDTITASEEIQAVSTRRAAGWQVVVATNDPGGEWSRLCDVAWDGSDLATSTVTDRRTFLFEGPADSTPAFRPTWGAGNDRNAARALHGVKTLERFASAVLKKIEEIQSTTDRWWQATNEPLDRKVSRDGDATLNGSYVITGDLEIDAGPLTAEDVFPDSTLVRDLGADTTAVWANAFVRDVTPGAANVGSVGSLTRRYESLFANFWNVAAVAPSNAVENTQTTDGTFSRVHFFESGQEATRFFDVGLFYESGQRRARFNVGSGLGGYQWAAAGTVVASLTNAGALSVIDSVAAATHVDSRQRTGLTSATLWSSAALYTRQRLQPNNAAQRVSHALEMLYEDDGVGNESWDGWITSVRRVFARDIGGGNLQNDGGRLHWSRLNRQNTTATVTDFLSLGPQIDDDAGAAPNNVSYSLALEAAVMLAVSHTTKRTPPPGYRAGLGALNCVAACAGLVAYNGAVPAFFANTRYGLTNLNLVGVDVIEVDLSIPFASINDYHVLACINANFNDHIVVTKISGTRFALRATPAGGVTLRDFTATTDYWISLSVLGFPPVA